MSKAMIQVQKERASERLRQEREIFEQRKKHQAHWFNLRLVMGYSAVVLLMLVMLLASYILAHHLDFPLTVVVSAGAALFADILGLLIGVWKIALNPGSATRLQPVTGLLGNQILDTKPPGTPREPTDA
jgi:uncharacterized membrane protein